MCNKIKGKFIQTPLELSCSKLHVYDGVITGESIGNVEGIILTLIYSSKTSISPILNF